MAASMLTVTACGSCDAEASYGESVYAAAAAADDDDDDDGCQVQDGPSCILFEKNICNKLEVM